MGALVRSECYASADDISAKAEKWVETLGRRRRWPSPPDKPALLVLDMQRYFLMEGHAFVPAGLSIIPNIRDMIVDFNGPVIFTRHVDSGEEDNLMGTWWNDSIGGERSEIHEGLSDLADDVIVKEHYSPFRGTDLEDRLRDRSVDSVVISGLMTDLCCETTAREAFMRGFRVYFLADATATNTEGRHLSSLKAVSRGFGEVLTSRELRSLL
ncbi:MAG: isochorismatase family protein [Thermoplasmatota archaeon]